ncbi:MAG: FMN-binding negative transcriptional regulator [Enterobacteriaceae bacterium]
MFQTYVPSSFQCHDQTLMLESIDKMGFATLITPSQGDVHITHLPTALHNDKNQESFITIHMANSNKHADALHEVDSLLCYNVADCYISPNWYPQKQIDARVVPTWNYCVVHVHVRPVKMSADELIQNLTQLTNINEGVAAEAWKVEDAPQKYLAGMMRGISGFYLQIQKIEGIWKLSQNKDQKTQQNIVENLMQGGHGEQLITRYMQKS